MNDDVESSDDLSPQEAQLSAAIRRGDLPEVRALLASGANVRYVRRHGYDALIDAAYARGDRLLETLALLVSYGAEPAGESIHGETALQVLAGAGRFDAVRLLVEAGADPSQLRWTPLLEAVAIGTAADVAAEIAGGMAALETRDSWSRTPWLVAVLTGDIAKAELLHDAGADTKACGHCGVPPLHFAVHGGHQEMVRFLLDHGAGVDQMNEFGATGLMEAVERDDLPCVELLLAAGADVHAVAIYSVLERATSRAMARRLLEADADPSQLSFEARRAIIGLGASAEDAFADISEADFRRVRTRRFGAGNPEPMDYPLWQAMVHCGATAYEPRRRFENGKHDFNTPVWCAQRYGQSLTFLPNGRVVQIGGEHEDHYDPDFCIYNDVFVHEADGSFRIYGYPESVFPPTDFHTATLVGSAIYVVGSLGYFGRRRYGQTPVFRLDLETLAIEPVECCGEAPGWIYKHRAWAVGDDAIRVSGGTIITAGEPEAHEENRETFMLDLRRRIWRRL
jgi:ankyrin repeat protein